jgi:pantoate--beta-alanine ligase
MSGPLLARTRAELKEALAGARVGNGDEAVDLGVALVPTMGALHDGHRSLARRAREVAGVVVLSIFVNPLQFSSTQDLRRYPRMLEDDCAVAGEEGVDVVWAPDVDQMYPGGEPAVRVSAGELGSLFEGASRPGHFDGVLTVVAKLFGQVRPDLAVFGDKDAQQVALVRRMIHDLELGVRLETVPTVRDADGLALSSRNSRLSAAGRGSAAALSKALRAASKAADDGASTDGIRAAARAPLDAEAGVVLDYLALVDPTTFSSVAPGHLGPVLVVVAGNVEGTRLIDNTMVVCR